jgi:hypothetical protein
MVTHFTIGGSTMPPNFEVETPARQVGARQSLGFGAGEADAICGSLANDR